MSDEGGQISETSMMTPDGGADGTPGTEDATPGAADVQHAPHEGPRDYAGTGEADQSPAAKEAHADVETKRN